MAVENSVKGDCRFTAANNCPDDGWRKQPLKAVNECLGVSDLLPWLELVVRSPTAPESPLLRTVRHATQTGLPEGHVPKQARGVQQCQPAGDQGPCAQVQVPLKPWKELVLLAVQLLDRRHNTVGSPRHRIIVVIDW